jgi:hypothetical protein
VGCRILLQSGWTKYGQDDELIADNIMVIGAMVSKPFHKHLAN